MTTIFTPQISKVKQLADTISQAISARQYKEGDPLPSINQLSKKFGVSRDTVFKAFGELKQKGIVDSTPTKGYFVCNAVNKVLLLLDVFSPFKHELHRSMTRNLPLNYKVDLYFHEYNEERFNQIILDSIGRYNSYIVMNYQNDVYSEILDELDPKKVLLLDFGKFEKDKFAYVCQGFDTTLYECMDSGKELFRKYKKIIFVYPGTSEHPQSCIPYFEKFCIDSGIDYEFRETVQRKDIKRGTAFMIVRHTDLVGFIKTVREKKFSLGEDIGVVVFNDEPMFEILDKGITAISTDFHAMGKAAANFIRTHDKIQAYIPTKLLVRGSL